MSSSSHSKSQTSPLSGFSNSQGSSTWGKQAAKRFDTSEVFKKDPLLKSLEGKIAVDFGDYKPWQRTSIPRNAFPVKPRAPKTKNGTNRPLSSRINRSSNSAAGISKAAQDNERPTSGATIHTQCSSVCLHPWLKKPLNIPSVVYDKKKNKFLSVLRTQIKARQRTIAEYQNRKMQLLQDNLAFKEEIESSEVEVHDQVKVLLQKYDKYRGALDTLNKTYEEDLLAAKKSLKSTKLKVNMELEEIQKKVNTLDTELKKQVQKTNILVNYKDKEYPEKALQIAKLKKKKETIAGIFKDELEELHAVINTETAKFADQTKRSQEHLKVKAVQDIMKSVSPSVQELAVQNMAMKKEIEMHLNEVKLLEAKNEDLEKKIQLLLRSKELNTREQLFPDVVGERVKCTPDMDVVLDIPTHKWLPI